MHRVLLFALFVGATPLLAQTNWIPATAYLGTQEIPGEVNDRDWSFHIPSVEFRPPAGEPKTYLPVDGATFEFGGRRLVAAEVDYITNTRDLAKITTDTVLNRVTETGYLRQYIGGDVALYQYVDPTRKRHFYLQRRGEPMVYLEYELRIRTDIGNRVLKNIDTYRYQLSQLLGDCPELAGDIAAAEYNDKSLTRLVSAWYRCRGVKPEFTARVDRGSFSVAPLAGFYRTTISVSPRDGFTASNTPDYGPAFGAGIRYTIPSQRRRFSARADVFYHSHANVISDNTSQEDVSFTTLQLEQSRSTLRIAALAEYRVLTGKVPVYVAVGLETGLLLENEYFSREIRGNNDGTNLSQSENILDELVEYQSEELGFVGEAGLFVGKLQLGFRFSRTTQRLAPDGRAVIRAGLLAGYWF